MTFEGDPNVGALPDDIRTLLTLVPDTVILRPMYPSQSWIRSYKLVSIVSADDKITERNSWLSHDSGLERWQSAIAGHLDGILDSQD